MLWWLTWLRFSICFGSVGDSWVSLVCLCWHCVNSPETQFEALLKHFNVVGTHTQALLISCFIKFMSCFSEIAPRIREVSTPLPQ